MTDTRQFTGSSSVITLESVFVLHFMQSLDRLQSTWMDTEKGFDQGKFNLQLLYLIRLLPDLSEQTTILTKWATETTELESNTKLSDKEKAAYSGMQVVSSLIAFICSAFDLTHSDVTGPVTNRQYMKEVIELPDTMPQELIERIAARV